MMICNKIVFLKFTQRNSANVAITQSTIIKTPIQERTESYVGL